MIPLGRLLHQYMFKIIYFQCGSFILKVTKWANTDQSSTSISTLTGCLSLVQAHFKQLAKFI